MSCAYRTHRYRASVTPHVTPQPASVSWNHPTGHAQHSISLHPLVVRPGRQVVLATADDNSIPVSLVQYLWSRWQESPPNVRDAVTAVIGELMLSPRWHWDVTVLPDQSRPDPQGSLVSSRDGRWTIGIPIAMLRELWRWVLGDIDRRASVLRRLAPTIDPALWQELRAHQPAHVSLTEQAWYPLYGYLSPVLLPDIAHTAHDLLSSADPDDQQMALTMLEQWLASDNHATRDLATQMLSTWLHARPADGTVTDARWMSLLGEMVRDHPSDDVIRTVLDRLIPTIVPPDRPDDRVAWAATLWTLITDSTLSNTRRQTIARALTPMMQDPVVATLVHGQLCTEPSLLQTLPTPICDTLLTGLIQTAHADAVLTMIAQEIRQNPNASARFDPIVAAGWGHGHDHRILQIIDSLPGQHWKTVLTQGITASVGAEVCDRIGSWFPRDQAMAMIVDHIRVREERGNWPLAPLPAYLIPWVGKAARSHPAYLRPTTVRRLWLTDPVRAWHVTQTMLDSGHSSALPVAIAAMDAGWGRGHDDTIVATLRKFILLRSRSSPAVIEAGIATAVAGLGIAPPSLITALLTELAMQGNENVRRQLISALHRGWGRGQDALVLRIVEMIAEQDSLKWGKWGWDNARATLIRAWDYHPRDVVVSLLDRLLTHAMNGLVNEKEKWFRMVPMAETTIAAFAPGWTHLPTAHMIERIAHHVAHLHAHAHTIGTYSRDMLVSAWASVVTAGADRLSASTIHALLAPLWDLSPDRCLDGVVQWVRR